MPNDDFASVNSDLKFLTLISVYSACSVVAPLNFSRFGKGSSSAPARRDRHSLLKKVWRFAAVMVELGFY